TVLLILRQHCEHLVKPLVRVFQSLTSFIPHFFHSVAKLLNVIVKIITTHIFFSNAVHSVVQLIVSVFLGFRQRSKRRDQGSTEEYDQRDGSANEPFEVFTHHQQPRLFPFSSLPSTRSAAGRSTLVSATRPAG